MKHRHLALGSLLFLLTSLLAQAVPPPIKADNDPSEPKPGMTAEEVRRMCGPPKTVARQILYGRYLEQWTYDSPAVRIEFDWRKGQPKQIQTVQMLGLPPR